MAILAAFLVIVTLDGPGLTVDEPLDVRPGRTYVESLTRERWRFFDRDVVIRVFRDNAEHPPLGRWLLGIASKLGEPLEVLWKGPDPTSQYVLSGRLAPAFAFAALVGVVVYQGTLRWGNAAGLGAGFALMAMPRVFAHAHLGALDTFLSLFWTVAVLAADGAIRSRSPVRNMALAGVCWGLVLLTKIHGWLLIPLVSVWSLYWLGFRRGSAVLVLWAAVGVGLFFAAWPWLWYDTWERFSHYWGTGLTRAPIRVAYFGEIFDDNELPWHYPWFYFAVTVPVGLQPLGLLGLLRGWRERRAEPLPILLAGTIVLFLALFSTRVPVYDGERLFLLVFPAWALLIGAGLAWVWSWCGSRRWLRGALVALVLAQSWGVVSIHPFGLSYFNAFVGGLRGAQRLGLELTYWGDAVSNRLLDRLAAEANPGEKAALVPTLYPGQGILTTGFDRTLARREVILGDEEQSLRADWVVVSRRVAYLRREFLDRLKNEGGTRVATTSRDGVVLAELWHFPPSSSGNPASRAGFRRSEE
jgi:4-amino-4-deoxy-L-arabinose transferase-like glycosyltransferase